MLCNQSLDMIYIMQEDEIVHRIEWERRSKGSEVPTSACGSHESRLGKRFAHQLCHDQSQDADTVGERQVTGIQGRGV